MDNQRAVTNSSERNMGQVYKQDNSSRYLSLLAIISSFAVVYLHANGCFWDFNKARYWISANIMESIFYFAVPVFFMISGATLLDYKKKYDLKTYFVKRAKKTLIPYVVWSMFGFLLNIFVFKEIQISSINISLLADGLINSKFVPTYWFFPILFIVYLSIPLLAAVSDNSKKEIYSYISILCFVINICIPFFLKVFKVDFSFPYVISVGSGYLLYVLVGYLFHKYEMKSYLKWIILLLSIIGLMTHILGTYSLSYAANRVVEDYKGYNNLPAFLYSIGIFIFVKNIYPIISAKCGKWLSKVIDFLKRYTLSLYLIHWFILRLLTGVFDFNTRSILYRLLIPILVIGISIGIVYGLKRIPFIKRGVPD